MSSKCLEDLNGEIGCTFPLLLPSFLLLLQFAHVMLAHSLKCPLLPRKGYKPQPEAIPHPSPHPGPWPSSWPVALSAPTCPCRYRASSCCLLVSFLCFVLFFKNSIQCLWPVWRREVPLLRSPAHTIQPSLSFHPPPQNAVLPPALGAELGTRVQRAAVP